MCSEDLVTTLDLPGRCHALLAVLSKCASLETLRLISDSIVGTLGSLPCAKSLRTLVTSSITATSPTADKILTQLLALGVLEIGEGTAFQSGECCTTACKTLKPRYAVNYRSAVWMSGLTRLRRSAWNCPCLGSLTRTHWWICAQPFPGWRPSRHRGAGNDLKKIWSPYLVGRVSCAGGLNA